MESSQGPERNLMELAKQENKGRKRQITSVSTDELRLLEQTTLARLLYRILIEEKDDFQPG